MPLALLLVAAHLVAALTSPASAQDSRAALRSELGTLWVERRYDELLTRVTPLLGDAAADADLWIMAGEAAIKTEDHASAIELFERGIELRPELARVRINLGFAYLKMDRVEEARKVFAGFERDADPERAAKARYGIGLVRLAEGAPDAAKTAFAAAAALDPADPRPHYRLGQLALQAGDHAGAIRSFETALRHDELHHGAAFGLARAHALAGEDAAARRWAGRHAAILEAQDAVAAMVRKLGDAKDPVAARIAIARRLALAEAHASAMAWFRRALVLDPASPEALEGLGAARSRAESRP